AIGGQDVSALDVSRVEEHERIVWSDEGGDEVSHGLHARIRAAWRRESRSFPAAPSRPAKTPTASSDLPRLHRASPHRRRAGAGPPAPSVCTRPGTPPGFARTLCARRGACLSHRAPVPLHARSCSPRNLFEEALAIADEIVRTLDLHP